MSTLSRLNGAQRELARLEKLSNGSFADTIAMLSFKQHVEDLQTQALAEFKDTDLQFIDFRLSAPHLSDGSAPLSLVAKLTSATKKLILETVLQTIDLAKHKKGLFSELERGLDLRLNAIQPGSSKLIISAKATPDLLDHNAATSALESIFSHIGSADEISKLGSGPAHALLDIFKASAQEKADLEIVWRTPLGKTRHWNASKDSLRGFIKTLSKIEDSPADPKEIFGAISLISEKKIELKDVSGEKVSIFIDADKVSEIKRLRLGEHAKLICSARKKRSKSKPYKIELKLESISSIE
ncbi:hypothetical protein [Marinomonas ostreistagni]|uniref:Flagellar hook-length control protein-like C-terminal domain-containing protein n=1 Tax=Marinomonas ostreistagni TaxID=359209 RepID=A0ABS0ZAV6_9GAMM|nr:hypothetical protein [Marinomonas ostreistagni]MBJ7550775.1 hypothetical protein [Marinomonas ostreistagni]